jgi:acetoacetyl-CoA synthetase
VWVVPNLGASVGQAALDAVRAAAGGAHVVPYAEAMAAHAAETEPTFTRMPFDHPLYILYSSGTTGLPKCMVHGAGGTLLQHWKELALHTDVHEGDVVFYFTTCGWMMWNWLVSALALGATIVLYDGAPLAWQPPSVSPCSAPARNTSRCARSCR